MEHNAQYWINNLGLKLHPEGGFYAETYKSADYDECNTKSYASSLIYFLLENNQFSAFHKLKSDEIWLYHAGCNVSIYIIDNKGKLRTKKLGSNPENNESLQVTVPANSWFAAELNNKRSYCIMSCMVSPGFIWSEFELANQHNLILKYPQYKELILNLSIR